MFSFKQFLYLINNQLLNHYQWPHEWPTWQWAEEITNPEQLQNHMDQFRSQLEDLTLEREFISWQLRILISWLQSIKNGDIEGYSLSDPEYTILYRKIQRLNEIHWSIVDGLNDLNDEVRARLGTKVGIIQQTLHWESIDSDERFSQELDTEAQEQFNEQSQLFQELEPQIFQRIQSLQESEPIPDGIAEHEETYYNLLAEYRRITNPNTTVPWDSPDEQAQALDYTERLAILERLVSDMQGLDAELDNIRHFQGLPEQEVDLDEEIVDQMWTLTNQEFLTQVPKANRLEYITNPSMTLAQVEQDTRVSFTFHDNHELYIKTTLWQATSWEPRIRAFQDESWTVFARRWLTGEFFSEHGDRLKIHEGTVLRVSSRVEDISEIQEEIDTRLEWFEWTDVENKIAQFALEKWYDHEFILLLFNEHPEALDEDGSLPHTTQIALELLLTDVARATERFMYLRENTEHLIEDDNGRLTHYFAAFVLNSTNNSWRREEVMREYWFTPEQIESTQTYGRVTTGVNPEIQALIDQWNLDVVPEKRWILAQAVSTALRHRSRYEAIAQRTWIPWELIAWIHYRESSFNFNTYLHNWQRLWTRTTIVPRWILFHSWDEAAIDALRWPRASYGNPTGDNLASQADFAERFNGLWYRNRGLLSPYVMAGSQAYERQWGMFVRDGVFSRWTRDPRVWVMPIVMALRAHQWLWTWSPWMV